MDIEIKVSEVSDKLHVATLQKEVAACYPGATVKVLPQRVENRPVAGGQIVAHAFDSTILVGGLPEDADAKAVTAIVREHRPEQSDEDERLQAKAGAAFDLLLHDPRFAKLMESR